MKKITICMLGMILIFLVACSTPSPEEIAVIETVISEIPVTVEVTREVEVIESVEIEVEVTREVEVEVTRLVEVVVTATATPTSEPTTTPSPTNTPVPPPTNTPTPASAGATPTPDPATTADFADTLLQTMITTRTSMQSFGGMIDAALRQGFISCEEVVATYDGVANSPAYDVTAQDGTIQFAYNAYRAAVQTFVTGAKDMTQNCRDFLADPTGGTTIPFQQWGAARQTVNNAVDTLHPGIQALEG